MLRLHAAASSCTQHVVLRFWSQVLCYACTLPHHLARNTSCYACTLLHHLYATRRATLLLGGVGGGWGGVITFLLLRSLGLFLKWKALKDFLPSNYHRKINGPHGSQVIPRMRQRVFQFCWRNSLKWPSPAQFLKQLAKLQGKNCSGVSFQDGEKLPPLPDVWFPMGKIPKWWFRNQATHGPVT